MILIELGDNISTNELDKNPSFVLDMNIYLVYLLKLFIYVSLGVFISVDSFKTSVFSVPTASLGRLFFYKITK